MLQAGEGTNEAKCGEERFDLGSGTQDVHCDKNEGKRAEPRHQLGQGNGP
jgi:hypothetical protein